jgi:hypothetical protein
MVRLDVHAGSTRAAAIDGNGKLARRRFGAGAKPVVAGLQTLPPRFTPATRQALLGRGSTVLLTRPGCESTFVVQSKTPPAAVKTQP